MRPESLSLKASARLSTQQHMPTQETTMPMPKLLKIDGVTRYFTPDAFVAVTSKDGNTVLHLTDGTVHTVRRSFRFEEFAEAASKALGTPLQRIRSRSAMGTTVYLNPNAVRGLSAMTNALFVHTENPHALRFDGFTPLDLEDAIQESRIPVTEVVSSASGQALVESR